MKKYYRELPVRIEQGVKRPGREVHRLSLSSSKVTNVCSYVLSAVLYPEQD